MRPRKWTLSGVFRGRISGEQQRVGRLVSERNRIAVRSFATSKFLLRAAGFRGVRNNWPLNRTVPRQIITSNNRWSRRGGGGRGVGRRLFGSRARGRGTLDHGKRVIVDKDGHTYTHEGRERTSARRSQPGDRPHWQRVGNKRASVMRGQLEHPVDGIIPAGTFEIQTGCR